jgi:hypothetical protein
MPQSVLEKIFTLLGAALIVAFSFFGALLVMDSFDSLQDPEANLIHITEATYGINCQGFKTPAGQVAQVKVGNATSFAFKQCDGASGSCQFVVSVERLGDPAAACSKDFTVAWRCGAGPTVYRSRVPDEADGKTASLTCKGRS